MSAVLRMMMLSTISMDSIFTQIAYADLLLLMPGIFTIFNKYFMNMASRADFGFCV